MKWELKEPRLALRDGAHTGKVASAAVLAAVALSGQLENGDAIAPINAISHATWGDEAFDQKTLSLKYSGAAILVQNSAMLSWGAIFEWLFGRAADRGQVGTSLLGGVLVSALAYIVDYKIVPPRYTPGIERHLSQRSVMAIYLVLALSLTAGGLSKKRR